MPSLLRARGYYTAGVGKWHLGLRWAARPGSTPDRTTYSGDAPVDWIDYTKAIEDGPTHHGFAEYFGVPASLDMRDYVYIEGDRVLEQPTAAIAGDILATVADAIGEPLPDGAGADSVSFLPVLRRPDAPFDRRVALVMQSGNGSFTIRDGRWKPALRPRVRPGRDDEGPVETRGRGRTADREARGASSGRQEPVNRSTP